MPKRKVNITQNKSQTWGEGLTTAQLKIVGYTTFKGEHGDYRIWKGVDLTTGEIIRFNTPSVLARIFEDNNIDIEDELEIIYTGSKPNSQGQPMKMFEVSRLEEISH